MPSRLYANASFSIYSAMQRALRVLRGRAAAHLARLATVPEETSRKHFG